MQRGPRLRHSDWSVPLSPSPRSQGALKGLRGHGGERVLLSYGKGCSGHRHRPTSSLGDMPVLLPLRGQWLVCSLGKPQPTPSALRLPCRRSEMVPQKLSP